MAKERKLLILGPSLDCGGGVSNFLRLLANYLPMKLYKYEYLTVGSRGRSHFYENSFIIFIKDIICYLKILIHFNPHIVHINTSMNYKSIPRDFTYTSIAKLFKCKVVFFIHGWHEIMSKYLQKKYHPVSFFFRILFFMPDTIIILADKFKNRMEAFGVERSKIIKCTMMIENDMFLKSFAPTSKKDINILFLSQFIKDKGVYEALRSVPIVLKELPNEKIKFVFAGDGPESQKIKELAKEIGVEKKIEFTGYVQGEEKIKIYKQADIFIFPTHHEAFPNVILEAMASGLPIVATGVGAIPEIVNQGVNGIILKSSDENEVAEGVIRLINNRKLLREMSSNNLKKAKEYDISFVCKRMDQIYASL